MPNPYQLRFPSHLGLDLSVHHFTLDEALDTPYLLNVTVTSPDPALPLASLIHQPVSFTISPPPLNPLPSFPGLPSPPADPALQRVWHGVVCEAWREDSNVQQTRYRFAIGPRLSLLAQGSTCRLFQNNTVQQVITALLQQHGFAASAVRFQLTAPLPTHAHLTQWRESDLQFISRLAAEAGLFYQFVVEEAGKEVLLFGDNLEHYGRGRLLDIPLRAAGGCARMTARPSSSGRFTIAACCTACAAPISTISPPIPYWMPSMVWLDRKQRPTGWIMPGVRAGVMQRKPPASPSCAIRLRRRASAWPVAVAPCCTAVRARCCGWHRGLMKRRMAG